MARDILLEKYLGQLRDDAEPTKRALAMAEAIQQHVVDALDDAPGDGDDTRWLLALSAAQSLVKTLQGLVGAAS
jgi:hypothetical protein